MVGSAPHPGTPRGAQRPRWGTAVLSLYGLAAVALVALAAAPHLATRPADGAGAQLGWRAVFALAAALNGVIAVGGLAGRAWVRPLAGSVHVAVALAAVGFGVAHWLAAAPVDGWLFEHVAKLGVHAGMAWWWWRGPLGRVVSALADVSAHAPAQALEGVPRPEHPPSRPGAPTAP